MGRSELQVRFWGVRGTVAAPGPSTMRFGGNTSCVEIRCDDRILVFDAGTGLRNLGQELVEGQAIETKKVDLFFSHCHYDHIEGLPFFAPLYNQHWDICMWSGHRYGLMTTEELVAGYMSRPYFPIGADIFAADLAYRDIAPGQIVNIGDGIQLKTGLLNHPDGATGYRVEFSGRSVAYITDTEHRIGYPDQSVLALMQSADIVIYDSTYCDDEFSKFVGYGHSTWQEGLRLSQQAGAKQFIAFHHLPSHDDDELDKIAARMEAAEPGSLVAREGMILRL